MAVGAWQADWGRVARLSLPHGGRAKLSPVSYRADMARACRLAVENHRLLASPPRCYRGVAKCASSSSPKSRRPSGIVALRAGNGAAWRGSTR